MFLGLEPFFSGSQNLKFEFLITNVISTNINTIKNLNLSKDTGNI